MPARKAKIATDVPQIVDAAERLDPREATAGAMKLSTPGSTDPG
jgi:hypothetical protein